MSTEETLRHFIDVAEPMGRDTPYAVLTDPSDASGALVRFEVGSDDSTGSAMLTTNDSLSTIWAAASGNLWVGSARGRVWTTADVSWDAKKIRGLEWESSDPDFEWKAVELPRPSTVSAIFGSSDRDVHVGTAEGALLHWDGEQWRPSGSGSEQAIARLHGAASGEVWAVGGKGLTLHFDGRSWQRLALPGKDAQEDLTGVWVGSKQTYICSAGGSIWSGDRAGLKHIGSFPYTFHGLVEFKGTLFLAGGDDGVCVLRGKNVEVERDTFFAVGVYALNQRLAFLQALQDPPAVVIHDPRQEEDNAWLGCFWD
jgi:hypothetical protein